MTLKAELKRIRAKYLPYSHWGVLLLAAYVRLAGLGYPSMLIFDETYYVKDAWTLTHLGYEAKWPTMADSMFNLGNVPAFTTDASFVVHPPLGKLLIGLGMNLFGGGNAWGWRIASAVFGIGLVWLVILVARQLLGSRNWASVAGLLVAIDGQALVLSRTALLDGFLAFFVLLAFYSLLRDREHARVQYTLARNGAGTWLLWNRPWLLATSVALGLATSIKWSGLYFAAAFGLYIVVSEVLLRLRYGLRPSVWRGVALPGIVVFVQMFPLYAVSYISTWTGWLTTKGGWDRSSDSNPFIALFNYHRDAYNFHVNLRTPHSYQSNPLEWLYLGRPTSFYYSSLPDGPKCHFANGCSSAITALGNPLIWWGALAALLYLTYHFARYRNRTEGLILLGFAAGWTPWLLYLNRTVFSFYGVVFLPFSVFALVYVLRSLWHRVGSNGFSWRPWIRAYLWLVAAFGLYFLNLAWGFWTPYFYWLAHMWFPSWI